MNQPGASGLRHQGQVHRDPHRRGERRRRRLLQQARRGRARHEARQRQVPHRRQGSVQQSLPRFCLHFCRNLPELLNMAEFYLNLHFCSEAFKIGFHYLWAETIGSIRLR